MKNISMGINIGHDRGVAIVKDGILIGALAQERVDRIKHSTGLAIPYEAIDTLLKYLDISIHEINFIGITSIAVEISELSSYYASQIRNHYNYTDFQLIPISHHLAHASASFYTSGFNKSLIFIADGGGDIVGTQEESESVFIAKKQSIQLLERRLQSNYIHSWKRPQMYIYPFMNKAYSKEPISIGKKYSQITTLLQMGPHGEGKTMGLSAYGKRLIDFQFQKLDSLEFSLTFDDLLKEIYQIYLNSEQSYFDFMQIHKADIARTMQDYTEKRTMSIIDYLIDKYDPDNICLGGGLFLNCPLNHNILIKYPAIHLHICPAAGDDGQAIGAAFEASKYFCHTIQNLPTTIPYLGICYNSNEIEQVLKTRNQRYQKLSYDKLSSIIANCIYHNKVVGILHGRSEIGPRALCHRSILANPCCAEMKDYLNEHVKHREKFRPFAPVVTAERQFDIFDIKQDSPYMLLAAKVKDNYSSLLPAITHVDGSARVQSVKEEQEPFIYQILKEFEKLSGFPVLLNTSFNDFNEPIVESPNDAIKTFLSTQIDVLVIENYLIIKEPVNHVESIK